MKRISLVSIALCWALTISAQDTLTLSFKDCLDRAVTQNISLNKARLNVAVATMATETAKADFLPLVSANITQRTSATPFANGGADKVSWSSNYGVDASWVLWNGGKLTNSLRAAEVAQERATLATQQSENTLKEQIAKLYIQALYTLEAIKVNERLVKNDEAIYLRSVEMQKNGQMSRSEVAQLKAEWENGKYNVVQAQTTLSTYLQQLKALLLVEVGIQIAVQPITATEARILEDIPALNAVYQQALALRPEVREATLASQEADYRVKIAEAGMKPTISLTGSLSDGHNTSATYGLLKQLKGNINATIGVSVSIPIFDRHATKLNTQTARYNKLLTELDQKDVSYTLYNTIETLYLDAVNYRSRYLSSKSATESATESYTLLEEKFKLGLTNIADLTNGRSQLINAEQTMLQNKYLCLLNVALLKFYQDKTLDI